MREATIHIPHDEIADFGLGTFVAECRGAGLRNLTELACQGDGCLFVATLESPLSEARLDELSGLQYWDRLEATAGEVVYLCKLATGSTDGEDRSHIEDLSSEEIRVDEAGIEVSVVGTQDALTRSIDEYDDLGVDVLLRRITAYTGPEHPLEAITARQRDILETAHDLGYFALPREAAASDVAAELDLDPSTVTEHLRRAERNLVTELLGA